MKKRKTTSRPPTPAERTAALRAFAREKLPALAAAAQERLSQGMDAAVLLGLISDGLGALFPAGVTVVERSSLPMPQVLQHLRTLPGGAGLALTLSQPSAARLDVVVVRQGAILLTAIPVEGAAAN